mgnify:CR=1 FL=1
MKICVAGKSNISIDVCEYILQTYSDVELYAITNKNDLGINQSQRSFWRYINATTAIKRVELADIYPMEDILFLSLEFDRIVRPELFKSKRLYNIHFSKLPAYKGMYTAALPILHGAKQTGVTLHCIDAGIDTGDIIAQRVYELTSSDTSETLYNKNIQLGTELVIEYLPTLIGENIVSMPQSSIGSTYFSKSAIDYGNLKINLQSTAYQVDTQIRAFNFRQYQLVSVNSYPIVYTEITNDRSLHKPGTILDDTESYLKVATIDYDILLYKDRLSEIINYCKNDDLNSLKAILNLKKFINLRNKEYGWTPLMVAAYNNSCDIVSYLISLGADVNAANYNGTTPLMYAKDAAIRHGNTKILELLLKAGADRYVKDYDGRDIFSYVIDQSLTVYDYLKNF